MDQESFERGLSLGLSAALVCIERDPRNPHAAVKRYSDQMQSALNERWSGKRTMIAADIFLPIPMMQAADIGGALPLARKGGA